MHAPAFIPFNDQYETVQPQRLIPFSLAFIRPHVEQLVVFSHRTSEAFNRQVSQTCTQENVSVVWVFSDDTDAQSEQMRDRYDDRIYPSVYAAFSNGAVISHKGPISASTLSNMLSPNALKEMQ